MLPSKKTEEKNPLFLCMPVAFEAAWVLLRFVQPHRRVHLCLRASMHKGFIHLP